MRSHRIEIAEDDALVSHAGIDCVSDYFLADLFGVAIWRSCLLYRGIFINRILVGLTINCA